MTRQLRIGIPKGASPLTTKRILLYNKLVDQFMAEGLNEYVASHLATVAYKAAKLFI